MITTDVLVIGAGPAGSVAAALLNKSGFNVRVVEKEIFPRFVIGESLLPRCMEVLEDCDLINVIKEKKFQEKFGAKFVRDNESLDFNFSEQFSKGWTWTWQVPRSEFDTTLINAVISRGVPTNFETTVTAIEFMDNESSVTTIQYSNGGIEKIKAKFIIDASGYGRVIPRMFNLDKPSSLMARKAVFAHMEDPNRNSYDEPNRIIILSYAPGAWGWIIPFSSGITSLGIVSEHKFFEPFGNDPIKQFQTLIEGNNYLKIRFGQSKRIFEPRKLEGWSNTSTKFFGDGFVLTGNVTEFLDPIFSSGVMFATVSSHLATNLVIKKLKGLPVNWQEDYTNTLQSGVDTFKAFVNGWYDGTLEKIFYSKNHRPEIKQKICSILAGYVWDRNNPFVKDPKNELTRLAKAVSFEERMNELHKNNE